MLRLRQAFVCCLFVVVDCKPLSGQALKLGGGSGGGRCSGRMGCRWGEGLLDKQVGKSTVINDR